MNKLFPAVCMEKKIDSWLNPEMGALLFST
jgi:hypothetical protein